MKKITLTEFDSIAESYEREKDNILNKDDPNEAFLNFLKREIFLKKKKIINIENKSTIKSLRNSISKNNYDLFMLTLDYDSM